MVDEVRVTDPQKIALLAWFDEQLSEFRTRPCRWQAIITAEGTKISGELSKRHQVCVRVDTGEVSVDGQVRRMMSRPV